MLISFLKKLIQIICKNPLSVLSRKTKNGDFLMFNLLSKKLNNLVRELFSLFGDGKLRSKIKKGAWGNMFLDGEGNAKQKPSVSSGLLKAALSMANRRLLNGRETKTQRFNLC